MQEAEPSALLHFYDRHEVVDETLNIKFLEASESLLKADLNIHAMTDVTNGGIRGDAKEISYTAGVKLVFEEERIRQLVNPRVLEMLEALEIDYLGVSIDALLIIAPPMETGKIKRAIRDSGVAVDEIGTVEVGKELLYMDGKVTDFSPRFREAAYTPIKKAVGQDAQRDVAEMTRRVDEAAENAVEKKRRFIERIRRS